MFQCTASPHSIYLLKPNLCIFHSKSPVIGQKALISIYFWWNKWFQCTATPHSIYSNSAISVYSIQRAQYSVKGPWYGVATISRMLKNIGLFCKRALQKRPVFCKETCIFKHPTHRSHPISIYLWWNERFQCAASPHSICWTTSAMHFTYMGWLRSVGSIKL